MKPDNELKCDLNHFKLASNGIWQYEGKLHSVMKPTHLLTTGTIEIEGVKHSVEKYNQWDGSFFYA